MEYQQLSLFEKVEAFSMYDGYQVINTVNILTDCGIERLAKGQIAYLTSKNSNKKYLIDFPNEFGGSYGIAISEKQFKEHFRYLNKKVYPKRKEIWNGNHWVMNPDTH
jgi:hypothetical protein